MKLIPRLALSVAAFGLMAGTAQAATIDFTDGAAWGAAEGTTDIPGFVSTTTYDGVRVRISTTGPAMTFNAADVHPDCASLTPLACNGDGLGVVDDEVTYATPIRSGDGIFVNFIDASDNPAPVNISSIGFLDLFGANAGTGDALAETAKWAAITDHGFFEGSATGTDTSGSLGYFAIDPNLTGVLSLFFYAGPSLTLPDSSANSDFALASIDIANPAVPEPATLLLTGVGLFGAAFGARRRRRRK